jgi:hypothetical protein
LIAYYDTGSIVDYLTFASHAGLVLRTGSRRGRDPKTLYEDADACLTKIAKSYQGITSCHTLYEIEGAMFSALKTRAAGIAHAGKMLIYSARPVILQSIKVMDLFKIEIKDLTKDLMRAAAKKEDFLEGGVKLGDTLHMMMAMLSGADLIITGDDHILSYDKKLVNANGASIRCLDTDEAKLIL